MEFKEIEESERKNGSRGPKRNIHIPKEMLLQLYEKEKLSIIKIAAYLKCSQDTVSRRLREYGIPRRRTKLPLPQEALVEMYEREGYTIKELASKYGCSHTTIGNRLHGVGIRCNQGSIKRDLAEGGNILRAYKSGNSASFIAKMMGISRWSVLNYLRKHHMEIRQSYCKKSLPLQEIKYLYDVLGMTTLEIAKIYKVKACTISARLREVGANVRGNRLTVNIKDIIEYYLNEGQSVGRTAVAFGCSYTAIRQRLMNAGIYEGRNGKKK